MNNTNISRRAKSLQDNELLVFKISGLPVFMWLEGKFWIRLESIAQWLGALETTYLLAGDCRLFLNDPDAGTYVLVDDLYKVSPSDVRATLNVQRRKMMAMIRQEVGGE
jgi:hypothetical protein